MPVLTLTLRQRGRIHRIELAVLNPRAESDEQTCVQAKSCQPMADALFHTGRDGIDDLVELLKGSAVVGLRPCEVLLNRPRPGFGGFI
jgi:hypothetical protein